VYRAQECLGRPECQVRQRNLLITRLMVGLLSRKLVRSSTATMRQSGTGRRLARSRLIPVGTKGMRLVHIDEVREYSENHSYRLPPEKRGRLKQSND
jgi:hypothetical protein